ncbi:MAG: hypothetical protein U0893_03745 [Chloroflexota bacterium]
MKKLRTGAPFVLLAVALIVTLALSGAVSADAWTEGEHVTPAQMALHDFYESLGQHQHHHAASEASASPDEARAAQASVSPMWSVAAPDLGANPGQVAQYLVGRHQSEHLLPVTMSHLPVLRRRFPPSLDAVVPDPPPRPVV